MPAIDFTDMGCVWRIGYVFDGGEPLPLSVKMILCGGRVPVVSDEPSHRAQLMFDRLRNPADALLDRVQDRIINGVPNACRTV